MNLIWLEKVLENPKKRFIIVELSSIAVAIPLILLTLNYWGWFD